MDYFFSLAVVLLFKEGCLIVSNIAWPKIVMVCWGPNAAYHNLMPTSSGSFSDLMVLSFGIASLLIHFFLVCLTGTYNLQGQKKTYYGNLVCSSGSHVLI